MKINPEHYATLKNAIDSAIADANKPLASFAITYKEAGLSDKRFMWDWFRASKLSSVWICDVIYPYAADPHIDTALRKIFKDKTLPSTVSGGVNHETI